MVVGCKVLPSFGQSLRIKGGSSSDTVEQKPQETTWRECVGCVGTE